METFLEKAMKATDALSVRGVPCLLVKFIRLYKSFMNRNYPKSYQDSMRFIFVTLCVIGTSVKTCSTVLSMQSFVYNVSSFFSKKDEIINILNIKRFVLKKNAIFAIANIVYILI